MASIGTPGKSGPASKVSPSKVRRERGSGELTEFCADTLQGSKQYVRQEPAQDPVGHDLAPSPPPPLACLPSLADPFLAAAPQQEKEAPSAQGAEAFGRAGSLSITPPCPSPELDALAAVSSGSSYGGLSSQGDSQPGSAASRGSRAGSLGRAFPLGSGGGEGSPEEEEEALAAEILAAAGAQLGLGSLPQQPGAELEPEQGQHAVEAAAAAGAMPAPLQLAQFGGGLGLVGAAPAGGPLPLPLEAPKLAAGILAAASGHGNKYPRVSSAPELELTEGDMMIGAGRSVVDETDFVTPVSLCLTPIRTRANTEVAEPSEPTPVAYADSLSNPADACLPKSLPALRPTFHIYASSTAASMAAPGAYNPYDRAALGGGGYQAGGGSSCSYGFSYGGAPAGPPTTGSDGGYWAAHQAHSKAEVRRPPPHPSAAAARLAAAAAAEAAAPAALAAQHAQHGHHQPQRPEEEMDFIVRVPGGVRRPPAPPARAAEEVEHIVMVPGMKRRTAARPLAAAFDAAPAAAAAGQGSQPCAVASPPAAGKAAGAENLPSAPAEEARLDAVVAVAAAPAVSRAGRKEGQALIKKVFKAVLMAGAAMAVAAPPNRI